jgi:hypothetical protein
VDNFLLFAHFSGDIMNNPSVTIAIPSGTEWKADFGMSLASMVAFCARPLKGGGHISRLNIYNTKGSILPKSRTQLVKLAMQAESSHILFIDSDQTFPAWTLHQLLSHGKDIVAANIATKVIPASPTARQFNLEKAEGDLVYTDGASPDLERVWRVGTGVMLVATSVFHKIKAPWFPISWNEKLKDYVGEDWNFCEKCGDAGIPIYVDHVLSRAVGHLGQLEYTHAFVGEVGEEPNE